MFEEDCSVHPSRKGRVGAGAGWAAQIVIGKIVSEQNGIKNRNVFMNILC
jgi:hypothetical protein